MNAIVLAFLTGCLAWFISWAYIKLLFFPKNPLVIGGSTWESVLHQITKQIPIDALLEENKKSSLATLLPFIDHNLDSFFKERLTEKMPIISMFIGEKTITQLKEVFIEELQTLFPDLISQFSKSIQAAFLSTLSSKWAPILETMLLKATQKLRWIAFLIGAIWGWVIYLILIHL
ncbi:MAG: hypothetical protein WCJ68_02950 [Chitinophagia bacterium]|jgi:hypothetical protein